MIVQPALFVSRTATPYRNVSRRRSSGRISRPFRRMEHEIVGLRHVVAATCWLLSVPVRLFGGQSYHRGWWGTLNGGHHMGPNARKQPSGTPFTQRLERGRRPPQSPSGPQERWVIKTLIPDQAFSWPTDTAYWGTTRDSNPGITPYRGSATIYSSENDALYNGYTYKEMGRLSSFTVEQLPLKPHLHSGGSGSGRA